MSITTVFDPPLITDSTAVFNTKAFDTVVKLNSWGTEANSTATIVNANAVQTAADRVQTGLDRVQTVADRVQTGLDASSASASAATAAALAGAFTGTSATSLTIGTGTKVFTTQAGEQYTAGITISAVSASTPTKFMVGQVTSYTGTTLTLNVTVTGGTGTANDWNLSLAGVQGPPGTGVTPQAVGFTLQGGTTPKTLTVDETASISGILAAIASSASVGNHEVYVKIGNGLGSVNTYVRRFTTTVRNVGTAITYADSATLGASFTINETGFYSVYYSDALSAGSGGCCIGINTSPTASAPTVFATPSSLAGDFFYTNVGVTTFSSRVVRLTAGDVLRPYNQFTTNGFGDAAVIIRKVGV